MQQLIAEGKSPKETYEALAMTDVRRVADMLRPIYERTDGQDGFVSIEVSPYLAQDTDDRAEQQKLKALEGKAAIANARLAYQEFKRIFSLPRFEALEQRGARVQRPLWASTSTKNPAYRDVLYVEELIAPDTVDTMTLKTIESFRDHGQVRLSIEDNLPEAKAELASLEEAGIHYDQVTRQLQEEGVRKFMDSFHKLFQCIESKQKVLQSTDR